MLPSSLRKRLARHVFLAKSFSTESQLINQVREVNDKLEKDVLRYRTRASGGHKFVEKLFLGLFDYEVLQYPEIRTQKEVNYLKQHGEQVGQIFHKIETVGVKESAEKLPQILMGLLKESEVTGMRIKHGTEGFGYLDSELSYVLESLSFDSSLCKRVAENENCGFEVLRLFGNESQKDEYLPKFLTGECGACLAHIESGAWVSQELASLKTVAKELPDGKYSITGRKSLVYNPNDSDIIFVSANINSESKGLEQGYTIFMVDKKSTGLIVHKPLDKIGVRGVEICDVELDNVIVSEDSVVGEVNKGDLIVHKIMKQGKSSNGSQCVGLMRKIVNNAIAHCIENDHFGKPLYKLAHFQEKIGKIAQELYSAESMSYLMTGRADLGVNVLTESIIVKVYNSEALNNVVHENLELIGKNKDVNEEFIDKLCRDSYFFSVFDDPNGYLKVLLGTIGVKYVLKQMKFRTESKYKPMNLFKRKVRQTIHTFKPPKMIERFLHLTFEDEGVVLEYLNFTLNVLTEGLIHTYGDELLKRPHELSQLAEFAIIMYEMTAVLGRASRSYCIGHRNSEVEVSLARSVMYTGLWKCMNIRQNLMNAVKGKEKYGNFGEYIINKRYTPRHPAQPSMCT